MDRAVIDADPSNLELSLFLKHLFSILGSTELIQGSLFSPSYSNTRSFPSPFSSCPYRCWSFIYPRAVRVFPRE